MKDNEVKIYLIGPFGDFRDKIISELPEYSFADPRRNNQANVAEMASSDMNDAEGCPISLVVFQKSRGVMSYSELGGSAAHNNHIIVVDENEKFDPLLKGIASEYFTKLDDAIDFLKSKPTIEIKRIGSVPSKYPEGSDGIIPLQNIYICGTLNEKLLEIDEEAERLGSDKRFFFADPERTLSDFHNIMKYDLVVARFPADVDWDRNACFMMGAAYAHDISIFMIDEHEMKYPALQGLARRYGTLDNLLAYVTEVNDLNIASEARNMYNFFAREREKKNKEKQ
ncbi:MAG: hypothetical protein NTV63_00400 [Candidatus Woesearchaeota archaeon]|nr:hypothetical protein [Candidatus Woesearchaeota archaeon]